MVLTMVDCN